MNDDGTVDGDMVGMTVSASARSTAMAVSAVGDSLRSRPISEDKSHIREPSIYREGWRRERMGA